MGSPCIGVAASFAAFDAVEIPVDVLSAAGRRVMKLSGSPSWENRDRVGGAGVVGLSLFRDGARHRAQMETSSRIL